MSTTPMPIDTRHAEARTRARAEAVRVYVIEENRYYQVRSASQPGTVRHLTRHAGGWRCDCPGYTFTGSCRHLGGLLRRLERSGFAARVARLRPDA